MLSSAPWLNVALALILIVSLSIFIVGVLNSLKKNNNARKLIKILVLFSLSVAILSSMYGYVLSGGALAQWHSLGFPQTDDPAVKVLDAGYVQAQSGNIYYFTGADREDGHWAEGNWEQVDKVTRKQFYLPSPGTCGTLPFLPRLRQDFIDSKSACVGTIRWSIAKIVYAIDDNGRVYSWWNDSAGFGGGVVAVGPWFVDFWFQSTERIFFLLGGMASCILGVLIVSLISFSSFLRRRIQMRYRRTDPVE